MRLSMFVACLACLVIPALGCGGSTKRDSGSVTGRVLLKDGSSPDAGAVNLYSPSSGDSAQAILKADGTFRLKQVPVGEYQVSVTPPSELPPGDPNYVAHPPSKIPPKYFSAATSGFTTSIEQGDNPLELRLD
jgi:hypothetical protein